MEAQMTTVVLLIVIISSATAEVKNLTGTEGGSITLPDPVKFGFVSFKRTIIAMVENGQIRILKEMYKDRLFWNETTGLFIVGGLQRNDSGIYTIDDKNRDFTASYQLKVYESIQTPAVTTLNVSAESCTLLCLVEKAEETTLSWYKDEDVVNHSSSALPLPYTVDKQHFSSSYRCVAANPAEEKTLPVNVHTSCSEQDATDNRGNTDSWGRRHYIIVICVVLTVIVVLVAFIIKYKYLDKTKRTTMHTQDAVNSDVLYTDILTTDRHTQEGNSPDSSGPVDRANLTTVYDKLEAHRMVSIHTDPADHVYDQTIDCPYA